MDVLQARRSPYLEDQASHHRKDLRGWSCFAPATRYSNRGEIARHRAKSYSGAPDISENKLGPHGNFSNPSDSPFKLSGNPIPSSGVSKIMNVAVFAFFNCPISFSSMTTSATQPLGRQRTKPARPTSWLSSFSPRPEGSSTPSGATTRIRRLFWSAVFKTITVRPALERSSATTLWIRAHCSFWAPGGVSQRICQSPCTDRIAPCAEAATVDPNRHAANAMAANQADWHTPRRRSAMVELPRWAGTPGRQLTVDRIARRTAAEPQVQ